MYWSCDLLLSSGTTSSKLASCHTDWPSQLQTNTGQCILSHYHITLTPHPPTSHSHLTLTSHPHISPSHLTLMPDLTTCSAPIAPGHFGQLLASHEQPRGKYVVTMATLDCVHLVLGVESAVRDSPELLACVMYLLEEVVPSHHKWRYSQPGLIDRMGELWAVRVGAQGC